MRSLFILLLAFVHFFALAQPAKQEAFNVKDKNGKKQGYWRKYHTDGKLRYEGNFKDDKAIGVFKYYYPSGLVKATNTYSLNGKKATAIIYFESGKIQAKGNFIDEKKDSTWLFYNADEVLMASESYKLNKKDGLSITYYPNGVIADQTTWKQDEKTGLWQTFWEDGKIKSKATLSKGDIMGRMVFYHNNGMVDLMGDYKNGNRDGEWVTYDVNGKIKLKELYNDGNLKETKKINGVFEEFYEDEILKNSFTYKEGKKDGAFIEYNEGAEKKMEQRESQDGFPAETMQIIVNHFPKIKGQYKNDKLDGEITYYKVGGKVDRVEVYKEGIMIGKK